MTLILALALLSGWGYDGFVQDPARARPAHEEVSPADQPESFRHAVASKGSRPAPPILPASALPKAEASAAPTVWRLADARGQVWEHTDPNWLRQWIQQRNAAPVLQPPPPTWNATPPPTWNVAPSFYSSCPSGRCPRR